MGKPTILPFNRDPDIVVDCNDNDVTEDISRTNHIEDIWVVKGDSFGNLHQAEDDGDVGSVCGERVS